MDDIKFFNPGQFISKRSLISTTVGVIITVITEWLLPYLKVPNFSQFLSPAIIVFTISVIAISSAMAKNITASIILGVSASLSFYNPTATPLANGYFSVFIIYMTISLFAGFFSAFTMTGQTALRLIGIIFGIQAVLGPLINLLLNLNKSYETYWANHVSNIALGSSPNSFPVFDVILGSIGLIYILAFVLIGNRVYSTTASNKAKEIVGQILIFLALAGVLTVNILFSEKVDQSAARNILGADNLAFLNSVFQKSISDSFTVLTLFNVFYVLPVAGMIIGIGLALISFQRADGTTGRFSFDIEGIYFALNLPVAIVIGWYSYYWYQLGVSTFYLKMETWYILFTLFTNLILINLVVAFIIGLFIKLVRYFVNQ